ncbi:sporulation protein YtxC [Texcoconibacillus texcoconensis]|uniref:Putative sporulation protein YtxC n=1 Tax=Texcoconibacillus texcoconensis TaxID=1095777 RepID=A0A840QMU8_9BACI|nr:putative sporulation protein YtxC [Texcoconibacillus texcoconensis]
MLRIYFDDVDLGSQFSQHIQDSFHTYYANAPETVTCVFRRQRKQSSVVIIHYAEEAKEQVTSLLASILKNQTLKHFEKHWLIEVLRSRFFYQDEVEIEQIVRMARQMLFGDYPDLFDKERRDEWHGFIYDQFLHFLRSMVDFSYDSFIYFRLKQKEDYLIPILETAIDEYKLEQSYQTMIETCRDFIANHPPKISSVHLVLKNELTLYDDQGSELDGMMLLSMTDDRVNFDEGLPFSERVISPLVSIAPNYVYVHAHREQEEIMQTLFTIFQERIRIVSQEKLGVFERS